MTTTRPLETGWLADTPVEDTLLRRYLHNQADVGVALAVAAGGRVQRTPEVVLAAYDVPVAYLRQAVLLGPLHGVDDPVLSLAEDFFPDGNGLLFSAWPTPDLAKRGWVLVGHPTFVARCPGLPLPAVRPGVAVRDAVSAADLALAEELAVTGYPLPEAAGLPANAMFPSSVLSSGLRMRTGWLDGEPAAVGMSLVAHGVVNLCLAATLDAGRRRGLWQALAAARIAERLDLPAVACTSDYSRPGFERLGFLPVTRLTLWLRPALA
jgi:hypothetical protein